MSKPHALRRASLAACALISGAVLSAARAEAATISLGGIAIATNAANTANQGAAAAGNLSSLNQPDGGGANPLGATGVLDPGGSDADAQIGEVLTGATRFAAATWADANGARATTSSYRLQFDVVADLGVVYDVVITHDLEGVLETASPGLLNLSCSPCAASVSNVTASVVSAGGGSVGGALVQPTALSIGGDTETDVLVAAAVLTISGLSGSHTLVIDFGWTSSATAGAGDDAAARFGLQPNGGATYSNPAASGPADGHFVTIQTVVTAVPEPASGALLALGLAALAARRRRPTAA